MYRILWIGLSVLFSLNAPVYAAGGGATSPYYDVPTPFVVNLTTTDGDITFLQVNAQFKTTKPEQKSLMTKHLPAIQHIMVQVLSEETPQNLRSVQGKKKLRERAVKELQEFMQTEVGEPVVEEIYFTGFIIQ